jgi:hypothetical protein
MLAQNPHTWFENGLPDDIKDAASRHTDAQSLVILIH